MLNWKNNLGWVAIIVALLFTSCLEQKVLFSFDDNVNTSFFKDIPGIGSDNFLKNDTVVVKADSILVYKSSFSEKYIEKDHLLAITELNDSTKIPFAEYWDVGGYSQEMYLFKYNFKVRPKEKPNAKIQTINAMLFFSVKYNGQGDCVGFGPSYLGVIDYNMGYIAFPTELNTKADKNGVFLKAPKQIKARGGYLFFTSGLYSGEAKNDLNIQKIVKLDINKVGSNKPLVFNIEQIFHDPDALRFHYASTLNLTQ